MLSQEEINALLNSISSDDVEAEAAQAVGGAEVENFEEQLTSEEKDAIGEISNISLGTSATTLSQLVNQKVLITTPTVEFVSWEALQSKFDKPCVYIQISYREGLDGNNILVLRERDVMVIADLMMGGDGQNVEGEVSELHLSAISEAMNQMMGSASTSLSSMIEKTVDISPPEAKRIALDENLDLMYPLWQEPFVKVSFKMVIGDLVDSEIMQLYSLEFARELYHKFTNQALGVQKETVETAVAPESAPQAPAMEQAMPQTNAQTMDMGMGMMGGQPTDMGMGMMGGQPMMGQPMQQPMMGQPMYPQGYMQPQMQQPQMPYMGQEVNVAPAQFQAFGAPVNHTDQQENIDIIMDVPLEVTVELGRTNKSIKEILDFAPGTIIELNKLAGEPVDVLVNGKPVAKGEVVVIEESFGIRITEIINR